LSVEGFSLLFELSRGPCFAYDPDTCRVRLANDDALAYYGYTREEFLDLGLDQILERSHQMLVQQQLSTHAAMFALDLVHRAADGRRLDVHVVDRAVRINEREIRVVQVQDADEIDLQRRTRRKQLDAVLTTVASMMRMRDPFTARHQFRVAALTTAIVHDLGLPTEEATGIVAAASVHDIGKQSVPAEFLSFAGRLSPIAMALVRGHSQAGHDLIHVLDTPWPISRMILEHHERLDGSGYPHGLQGDSLLLGSQIIAVADTAEAMMSHRPYRAAQGREPALAELDAGKGSRYEESAVLACFRAIRDHAFQFPDAVE
jgi:PAS domain S-box-containing protein